MMHATLELLTLYHWDPCSMCMHVYVYILCVRCAVCIYIHIALANMQGALAKFAGLQAQLLQVR